jgi:alpha-D-ribose 1-methylphosphonate 5-triphosphate diphosphatase
MAETILRNARLVLDDRVVEGAVVVRDGRIAAIDAAGSRAGEDLGGDFLLPGLVELHTDALENHYAPRPGVRWDPVAAVQAHDAQIAGSGITTVFDALRVGSDSDARGLGREAAILAEALGRAGREGRLRAEHYVHLRCEVSSPDVVEEAAPLFRAGAVRLASLMDHSPGQRQFVDLEAYTRYYRDKAGLSADEMREYVARRRAAGAETAAATRPAIGALARASGTVLASHDDATDAHVAEAVAEGATIAEFPTTVDAAAAAHAAGLKVLMGAPNVVRGGSHSGNVSALALAGRRILDVLSSDYVPFSLMQAIFRLPETVPGFTLPEAVRLVTRTPAEVVGLSDRGSIAEARRADLVRVDRRAAGVPVVRAVWREGERVA